MPDNYYSDKLYPFQDEVLGAIQSLKSGFYLTGGTALGRCYLNHRYSDDLDFFVNDVPFHAGPVEMKNGFGRVDSWRNILSNKICAMSRMDNNEFFINPDWS